MNNEVNRIDKKVKNQLKMLDEHEALRDAREIEANAKENARPKPRLTYLAANDKFYDDSRKITQTSRELMIFTTQWNIIKGKLDAASDMETGDPDEFEKCLLELKSIKPKELFEKCAKVKAIKRYRALDESLRNDLMSQYEFMRRVYKNAPTHLKHMRMSPARRNAANQASSRMRARWGSF